MKQKAFTRCINVRNVNEALAHGLAWLWHSGDTEESRNGPVLVSQTPVITCYECPRERVLFSPMRDCNPFFHLMESLWMLAGRDDVEWICHFNSTFHKFSDNGKTFWGAYGRRWRGWFGYDQLEWIAKDLRNNPASRRAVLTMWNAMDDPGSFQHDFHDLQRAADGGKDVPCNTNAFFRIHDGRLNMEVNCRSNDILWGAYGANAVHFSMLLEYMAALIGVEVGVFWQNSFNFHVYTDVFKPESFQYLGHDASAHDYYSQDKAKPLAIMNVPELEWHMDLENFFKDNWADNQYYDLWFHGVAVPMRMAWDAYKQKAYATALRTMEDVLASDWRIAGKQWLERRREKYERNENVGRTPVA